MLANLGDSGFRIIRAGECAFASEVCQCFFCAQISEVVTFVFVTFAKPQLCNQGQAVVAVETDAGTCEEIYIDACVFPIFMLWVWCHIGADALLQHSVSAGTS